jgi:hypothetical protein
MLLAGSALATTARKLELPELVSQSDTIVQGRVDQVWSQWDANRKLIFTYISVSVEEPVKGARLSTVTVKELGGSYNGMNMSVVGMPHFAAGSDVLLFLGNNNDGTYHVVGLGQGKYTISNSIAIANMTGVDFVDNQMHEIASGTLVDREPLESFKAKIRGMLK